MVQRYLPWQDQVGRDTERSQEQAAGNTDQAISASISSSSFRQDRL
jgi:hypothetical protein